MQSPYSPLWSRRLRWSSCNIFKLIPPTWIFLTKKLYLWILKDRGRVGGASNTQSSTASVTSPKPHVYIVLQVDGKLFSHYTIGIFSTVCFSMQDGYISTNKNVRICNKRTWSIIVENPQSVELFFLPNSAADCGFSNDAGAFAFFFVALIRFRRNQFHFHIYLLWWHISAITCQINYVDLSDLNVDLSIIYVDFSDHYVDLSEKYHHN